MMILLRKIFLIFAGILTVGTTCHALDKKASESIPAPKMPITLVENRKSAFQIVLPQDPTGVDLYSAEKLALYLRKMTGAAFPLTKAQDYQGGTPAIFVGVSPSVVSAFGGDPAAGLQDQEHVARSKDGNIYLYGKGVHGNLYAAVDFLENSMGWRWFSPFEAPVLPDQPNVVLESFNRRKGFSFLYRICDYRGNIDFSYLHGANLRLDTSLKHSARAKGEGIPDRKSRPYVSVSPESSYDIIHSCFSFIPPTPDTNAKTIEQFPWLKRRNYFETNPEFFSMNTAGVRVPNRQLNFGNPELREELTKNILKYIEVEGDDITVVLAAMDSPGHFCYSPESIKLEEKYQTNGGPFIDYLIELCAVLKEKYPKVMVKTMAYRQDQTQKPPVLPEGQKLPSNLIVEFAAIDDNYFADWSNPDERIQRTYADLKGWAKITAPGNLWCWLYPNPWGTGYYMPVGNIQRNIINIRMMYKAGARGLFLDHKGLLDRTSLSELQSYLFFKLMQDVNCDTDALTVEFTDNMYGAASPLLRKYLKELETGRTDIKKLQTNIRFSSGDYDEKTFPYLTVQNIHRWQGYFDEMEHRLTSGSERERINLRRVRRELDLATLWKWTDLQKAYPSEYTDYKVPLERIKQLNALPAPSTPKGDEVANDFVNIILAGGKKSPLPDEFKDIAPSRIQEFLPTRYNPRTALKLVLDPEAASGYAIPVDDPGYPFPFGFHQMDMIKRIQTHLLKKEDITPGKYRLYEVGEVIVSPESVVYFGLSWGTHFQAGARLYEAGADNVWKAYVSLKFDGPTYGGKAAEDSVLVDRIIFVDQNRKEADEKSDLPKKALSPQT